MIRSWSSTQAVIALSSGEAEYYGLVRGAPIGMGAQSMLRDMGVDCRVRVSTDASAAKGIASRRGLGKVRHIEVNQLWVQDKVSKGELEVRKVSGSVNISDALTKYVESERLVSHMISTGQEYVQGRHCMAPRVSSGQ